MKPVMKIKLVRSEWVPKWSKFKPPKWWIFKWAYKTYFTAKCVDQSNLTMNAVIQDCNKSKNNRTYDVNCLKEALSNAKIPE